MILYTIGVIVATIAVLRVRDALKTWTFHHQLDRMNKDTNGGRE